MPLGAPVYLATTEAASEVPMQRLMMAQDTGGAIRGAVRADFFYGFGSEAARQGGPHEAARPGVGADAEARRCDRQAELTGATIAAFRINLIKGCPMQYEDTDRNPWSVALITLNRPQALNALNAQIVSELNHALDGLEADSTIGCIVLTGSKKPSRPAPTSRKWPSRTTRDLPRRLFSDSDRVANRRKPIIAAVNGFALGGGCELALMCDFILAGDNAKFGQPEINLGVLRAWAAPSA